LLRNASNISLVRDRLLFSLLSFDMFVAAVTATCKFCHVASPIVSLSYDTEPTKNLVAAPLAQPTLGH
jgi:hypothetical protein